MSIGKPAWKKLNSVGGADIYSYHWIKQKKKWKGQEVSKEEELEPVVWRASLL